MACTWVGTKFSHRVPEGMVLARCFASGDVDAAELTGELRQIAGIRGEPRDVRVYRWPRSMAQYRVGHLERMAELTAALMETPWLHVAGNAYSGIGIPDCIRMGRAAAENIARYR